jgi:hypothetical protein
MIDLYLYDDGIVFDHDCNSCEIKCIDIELYLLNVERWKFEIGYGNISLVGFCNFMIEMIYIRRSIYIFITNHVL